LLKKHEKRYGHPMTRPKLAITLGDPTGIGPEITAAVLEEAALRADIAVFGHWPSLLRELKRRGHRIPVRIMDAMTRPPISEELTVIHTNTGEIDEGLSPFEIATAQLRALDLAIDALLAGHCDVLVTAPVEKASVATISPGFKGHTEHLAARAGLRPDDVTMVFASRALAVGLLATHIALRDVPDTVTSERCERTLRHVVRTARALSPARSPRIAVAALNPHAGEGGLLGTEEQDVLVPFCEAARARGMDVSGPIAADAVFRDAFAGAYDGVVSAYHDQAMIPLKLCGFGRTANVTAGLPFIRTSPDHGTARDIAGKGIADPSGMRLAVDIALALQSADRGSSR